MRSLQAPVVCPAIRPRQVGACASLVNYTGLKPRRQFWGNRTKGFKSQGTTTITLRLCDKSIKCVFSSHSDGNGSTAENFNENDEEYVNSSVVEAGKLVGLVEAFLSGLIQFFQFFKVDVFLMLQLK